MYEIIIAGIFTIIGAMLGFTGTIIQSRISAKNNIKILEMETEKEIAQKRYFEKEKLYSDIIEFLPQLLLSANFCQGEVVLAKENKILLNSLKPRLNIYSSKEITKQFYEVADFMLKEKDDLTRVDKIEEFVAVLLNDLDISKKRV